MPSIKTHLAILASSTSNHFRINHACTAQPRGGRLFWSCLLIADDQAGPLAGRKTPQQPGGHLGNSFTKGFTITNTLGQTTTLEYYMGQ